MFPTHRPTQSTAPVTIAAIFASFPLFVVFAALARPGHAQAGGGAFEFELRFNETRLDGTVQSIRERDGSLLLAVTGQQRSGSRAVRVAPPQTHWVLLYSRTTIRVRGEGRAVLSLADLRAGDSAIVIGTYADSRKGWIAREIAVWDRVLANGYELSRTRRATTVQSADDPVSSAACVTPPEGLLGWWKGDGDARDALRTSNGSTREGATFLAGLNGQAFGFNGQDDFVEIPRVQGLTQGNAPHTIEGWLKVGALPAEAQAWVLLLGSGGIGSLSHQWSLQDDGRLVVGAWDGAQIAMKVPLERWVHVASTFDGATLRAYLDGQQVQTSAARFDLKNARLLLGKSGAGPEMGADFTGGLDEVAVYKRALTGAEIGGIYRAGRAGKCALEPDASTTSSETSPARGSVAVLASIEGSTDLHLKDNALWYVARGRRPGSSGARQEPTLIGSRSWRPTWIGETSGVFSEMSSRLPAFGLVKTWLEVTEAAGDIVIVQSPQPGNGYELVVRMEPPGAAPPHRYNFKIHWNVSGLPPAPTPTPTPVQAIPTPVPPPTSVEPSPPTPVPVAPPAPTPAPAVTSPTPAVSIGGSIVFGSNRDGNFEIYICDGNGGNPVRLTNHPAGDGGPVLSPDGRRVAFASDRDGNFEIYVMNVDGTGLARVTNAPGNDFVSGWSRDGQRLLFDSERDGNREIYVMDVNGAGLRRLTTHPAIDAKATLSPDGRRMLWVSNRDGNLDIYSLDLTTQRRVPKRLTTSPGNDTDPVWSPDGKRIVFVSRRDGNEQIYIMNADGRDQVRLTKNEAHDGRPTFAPGGRSITFNSDRDGNFELYTMHSDGSQQSRLTQTTTSNLDPFHGVAAQRR